ncbi:hypothetical protein T492DRAFT_1084922 [Pavlovales sp. CCMP2436]|nr:hypothetical protein T492DRAFT_1084922 [Pavlovales sp. CCMP2436]
MCWKNEALMVRECPDACTLALDPLDTAEGTCESDGVERAPGDSAGCAEKPAAKVCVDEEETRHCRHWAMRKECAANPSFMLKSCCRSCAEWRSWA